MSEPKFTNEQVIAALRLNGGLQAHAARTLSCSLRALHNYLEREPEIRDAYDELRELRLDDFELTITKLGDGRDKDAANANERLKAAQCGLTTAWAKHRGYNTGNIVVAQTVSIAATIRQKRLERIGAERPSES